MKSHNSIRVSFLGGAGSIGASCTVVRAGGVTLVIDCGVRYCGPSPLPDLSLLSASSIDAVLLTHAHMDHSGGLPVLAEAAPGAPVFATAPTIDLVKILLRDALRLMNSPEREADVPLYSPQQLEHLLRVLVPVQYYQPIQIGEVRVQWLPASHILGAAMILLETPAGTVLFTGDYSVTAQQTVPALGRPDFVVDLVVSESTYGERLHEDRSAAEQRLVRRISEVVERGGRVLIPAFAVGRAQEVLLILKRAMRKGQLPPTPVFVDGMVRAVCDVYRAHQAYVSRQLLHEIRRTPHPFYTDCIRPVAQPEDRGRVLQTSPCVIVSSSGMLTGGPSVFYCRELVGTENDAILLTGYQDEESPGRALLELAEKEGPKELRLGQTTVSVACQFDTYGLSAHADRMQMVSWIEALRPRTVVLVHGDGRAKSSLSRSLSCRDVILAEDGLTLERSYVVRRRRRRCDVRVPTEEELDVERARHLLGPPGPCPLRAAEVAEAWFGEAVDRSTVERFVRVLESVGLVRRDDHRRDRLWVLSVRETDLFPDEAALEERLKEANPKGRLLEFCMRSRVDPPHVEVRPHGAFFQARMKLRLADRTLDSGECQAASKKTAEQLAAERLLKQIEAVEQSVRAVAVTDEDARRLQSANPKGKLLEWCARNKVPPPTFEQVPTPAGFRVRVVVRQPDRPSDAVVTDWYEAARVKTAEHAAAETALARLLAQAPGNRADSAAPMAAAATGAAVPGANGRTSAMALNELRQAGRLEDYGYELLEQNGPSHQPTFRVVAWARLPDGRSLRTDVVEASAKKAAQRLAADRLMERLAEAGVRR